MVKIYTQKIFLSNDDISLSEVNLMESEKRSNRILLIRSLFRVLEVPSRSMLEWQQG